MICVSGIFWVLYWKNYFWCHFLTMLDMQLHSCINLAHVYGYNCDSGSLSFGDINKLARTSFLLSTTPYRVASWVEFIPVIPITINNNNGTVVDVDGVSGWCAFPCKPFGTMQYCDMHATLIASVSLGPKTLYKLYFCIVNSCTVFWCGIVFCLFFVLLHCYFTVFY